jgi:hypothetical protein
VVVPSLGEGSGPGHHKHWKRCNQIAQWLALSTAAADQRTSSASVISDLSKRWNYNVVEPCGREWINAKPLQAQILKISFDL